MNREILNKDNQSTEIFYSPFLFGQYSAVICSGHSVMSKDSSESYIRK